MRCPKGSVRISRALALKVLDWHGGQSTPTYAVGSSGFAGRCIPKPLLRRASWELRNVLQTSGKFAPRVPLERLIVALEKRSS